MQGVVMYKKIKGQSYYTNRHSCFLLTYHAVLVTKYRNPVLTGAVKESVYSTIRTICEEKNISILEMNGEPDHVHILFEAGPDVKPLELMSVLKTKTARFARRDHPFEVEKYYWEPHFWSNTYFITTVGVNNLAVVSEYIQNQ